MCKRWRFRCAGFLALLALYNVAIVTPVAAGVAEQMRGIFDGAGGAANVTGPSAFNGQSAGYYSLGNVWTRFPQKSIQPFNLQLPSARAGCGGIDLFTGSFSFINTAEMVAMLKATANNAIGFAFKLAIDAVSPQISKVMDELAQKVQQMNQMNISSCELAKSLVNDTVSSIERGRASFCQTLGPFEGKFADAAKARQECNAGGKANETLSDVKDPAAKAQIPGEPANFAWDVLKNSPKFAGYDDQFKEFIMTFVGTVTTNPAKPPSTAGPTVLYFGPGGESIMTALLDGTATGAKVNILRCDETSICVTPAVQPLTISQADALRPKLRAMIVNIQQAIRTNQRIGGPEKSLLNLTTIPLYKILAVQAAANVTLGDGEVDTLAEIAAVDLLQEILRNLIDEFRSSTSKVNNADPVTVSTWRTAVDGVSREMASRGERMSNKLKVTIDIINRSVMLESTLQNSMSPGMAAALNFSRGLNAQGLQ